MLSPVKTASHGGCWIFFSNHFSVSARGAPLKLLAHTLERDAIAPYLFSRFEHMLIAVTRHPAMLLYLNNERSFGPNSIVGRRGKDRGLNENLAREILELHTLGVDGGYTQQDVIELAMAISGWSITHRKERGPRGYIFRAAAHEPGVRQVLGKRYKEDGEKQGMSILKALAQHPSTAHFVSYKLARHFVSDEPPATLVTLMRERWLNSGGDLHAVITELIKHDQAWHSTQRKFKSPREFMVSACRAASDQDLQKIRPLRSLVSLGQVPFGAGSPAGYGDLVSDWDGADALLARIDWAAQFGKRIRLDARTMARNALGPTLDKRTENAIANAESRSQAVALFLMSPEFLRR